MFLIGADTNDHKSFFDCRPHNVVQPYSRSTTQRYLLNLVLHLHCDLANVVVDPTLGRARGVVERHGERRQAERLVNVRAQLPLV